MSLGIYIQVPFCQTKCTYCNFHTGPAARSMYAPYARAVEREIRERAAQAAAALGPVDTIYLGGGTPSLLDPADLASILSAVRESFPSSSGVEITLEADPETIDAEKARRGAQRASIASAWARSPFTTTN